MCALYVHLILLLAVKSIRDKSDTVVFVWSFKMVCIHTILFHISEIFNGICARWQHNKRRRILSPMFSFFSIFHPSSPSPRSESSIGIYLSFRYVIVFNDEFFHSHSHLDCSNRKWYCASIWSFMTFSAPYNYIIILFSPWILTSILCRVQREKRSLQTASYNPNVEFWRFFSFTLTFRVFRLQVSLCAWAQYSTKDENGDEDEATWC